MFQAGQVGWTLVRDAADMATAKLATDAELAKLVASGTYRDLPPTIVRPRAQAKPQLFGLPRPRSELTRIHQVMRWRTRNAPASSHASTQGSDSAKVHTARRRAVTKSLSSGHGICQPPSCACGFGSSLR